MVFLSIWCVFSGKVFYENMWDYEVDGVDDVYKDEYDDDEHGTSV